jgi:hypothetical protein
LNRSEVIAVARECLTHGLPLQDKLRCRQILFAEKPATEGQIRWLKALTDRLQRPASDAPEGAPMPPTDGAATIPAPEGKAHQGGASGAPEGGADRQEE